MIMLIEFDYIFFIINKYVFFYIYYRCMGMGSYSLHSPLFSLACTMLGYIILKLRMNISNKNFQVNFSFSSMLPRWFLKVGRVSTRGSFTNGARPSCFQLYIQKILNFLSGWFYFFSYIRMSAVTRIIIFF